MIGLIDPVAAALLVVAWLRVFVLDGLRALHILQLEEYQTTRYWRWLAENFALTVNLWLVGTFLVVTIVAIVAPAGIALAIVAVAAGVGFWQSLSRTIPTAKKPLVLTARARRLAAGYVLSSLVVGYAVGSGIILWRGVGASLPVAAAAALLVVGLVLWPLASVGNLLLFPIEASFRSYYLWDARRILQTYHPVVVGIAGSYGKTSTKNILAQILSSRYPTLATPRSFNTPMGLCRVIREQLRREHRFFIAELGAYQRGEIRELCRLVRPTIGVVTAIGPEHLERFGSMENVVKAEFEIVESLPANGLAIFNGGDDTCRELARRSIVPYVLVAGDADPTRLLWAEELSLTSAGLQFTICHRDGRRAATHTRLLGRHNVTNILAASAAALQCGTAFEDLSAAVERLEPVEHRLQLVPNDNGVVVIDDTYNSNPRGAEAALETLAHFQGGRRYLVTPGMVELADLQENVHLNFGRQAASVCDMVILIGPRRTEGIATGLGAAGFDRDRVIVTRNLTEATEKLRGLLQRGDAVLFENDLPDNYVE